MRKNTIMYLASYSSIVQTFDKCKNLLKKLAPAPVSDVEGVGTYNLFVAVTVWGGPSPVSQAQSQSTNAHRILSTNLLKGKLRGWEPVFELSSFYKKYLELLYHYLLLLFKLYICLFARHFTTEELLTIKRRVKQN